MMTQILVSTNELSNCCMKCGGEEFPYQLMVFVHNTFNIVMVAIPVLLVILGIFDFVKATSSQKEDEMKKAQSQFVRRIAASVLVFFVIAITKFLFSTLSNLGFGVGFTDCLDAFVNGDRPMENCKDTVCSGTPYDVIPGDLNGDGQVNDVDSAALTSCISIEIENCNLTPEQKAAADFNNDGVIDISDALAIEQLN